VIIAFWIGESLDGKIVIAGRQSRFVQRSAKGVLGDTNQKSTIVMTVAEKITYSNKKLK
jgi:hypothetical protein